MCRRHGVAALLACLLVAAAAAAVPAMDVAGPNPDESASSEGAQSRLEHGDDVAGAPVVEEQRREPESLAGEPPAGLVGEGDPSAAEDKTQDRTRGDVRTEEEVPSGLDDVTRNLPAVLEKTDEVAEKAVPQILTDVVESLPRILKTSERVPADVAVVPDSVDEGLSRDEDDAGDVRLASDDALNDAQESLTDDSKDESSVLEDAPRDVPVIQNDAPKDESEIPDDTSEDVPEVMHDTSKDVPYSSEVAPRNVSVIQDDAPNEMPVILGDASKDASASLDDAPKDVPVILGDTSKDVPVILGDTSKDVTASLDDASEDLFAGLGDALKDVPLVQEGDETPGEALHKARLSLQRTLDQVLLEAEEWAKHEHQDDGQAEGYEYDEDQDGLATPGDALHRTRADLQRRLDAVLSEAEEQALAKAMVAEGSEDDEEGVNAISEQPPRPAVTISTTTANATNEGEVPDDGTENQIQGKLVHFTDIPDLTLPSVSTEPPTTAPPMLTSPRTTTAASTSTEATSTEATSTTTSTEATSTTTSTTPSTTTPEPRTTESPWRYLVVPLEDKAAEDSDSAAVDVVLEPGTAAIQGAGSTRQVAVPEDIVEAAVVGAMVVQADRKLSAAASPAFSSSPCPTKQPAPLRLPPLPNAAPESGNPQCAGDSRLLDLHIRNHTLWAVQMQDAGSGGVSGLLEGNVYHLGDFDECMDVRGPVAAQYCVAEVHVHTPRRTADHRHHPDLPTAPVQSVWNRVRHEGEAWRLPLDTLYVALCAPASCGARDLQDSVQRALDEHARCNRLPVAYTVTLTDALCTSARKQSPPLSGAEITYIALLTFLVLVVFAGTLIDLFATKKKGLLRGPLMLFSAKRNLHLLAKNDPKPMGLNLDALSGARTLNMITLVIAHRAFNAMRGPVHNYNHFEAMPRAALHTGGTHAQLFVDTCFMMSGLLVSLLELTRAHACGKEGDSRSTLMAVTVHRYVRLTPSYALVIFFYATIFWRLGSGPLWDQVIGHERDACAQYWWTNIFYVNNYINTDKLCMLPSWYLPCDLHLFFVGSALTMLLARHRRTGLASMLVLLVAAVLVPFFVTLLGKKPALLEMLPNFLRAPDLSENFRTMYAPTHVRAAPYMVGLLVGYLFQRLALKYKDRFTQGVTWLLCLGGVALTTASLLSSVFFYDPDMPYNGVAAGLYAALCPVVWSVGVALILASLVLGSRTILSDVVSWKPLVVLSRLTYNVYLTHWAFQLASVAKARSPFHLDVYNLFYLAFGDLVASFLASLALFIVIEAPFRTLARSITATPPESKVHLEAAQEKRRASALEAGLRGAIPKQTKT